MTSTIQTTEVRELVKVKISCPCGYAFEFPVSANNALAGVCPLCAKQLPINGVLTLNRALTTIQESLKQSEGVKVSFDTKVEK